MTLSYAELLLAYQVMMILGNFNAYSANLLGSHITNHAGRAVFNLTTMANGLLQLFNMPTQLPDVYNHNASLLHILLTSHPERYYFHPSYVPDGVYRTCK